MTASTPEQAISIARLIAAQKAPYFRTALCGLIPREAPADSGIPTMATGEDCVLLWNRDFVMRTPANELAAALIHELGHVLHEYWKRGTAVVGCSSKEASTPEQIAAWRAWNVAHDAEINDDLKAGGWAVGVDWVFPRTLQQPDFQLAETYLDAAKQKQQDPGLGHGGCCQPGNGGSKPGRSPAEVERLRKQAAEEVRSHAARKPGSVPAGWARWADLVLKPPTIRWQDKLARICRVALDFRPGQQHFSYDRPSRRQHGAFILPRMREPIARVMVAVDTSGSMGPTALESCLAETAGIMRAVGAEVVFVACDAEVHSNKPARHWREVLKLLRGGGGTDFHPIIDAAMKARPQPEVLIILTDGCGPAPAAPPPGIHVIWCLVGGTNSPARWGSTVVVDPLGASQDK